jgi:cobyric acid synthase
MTIEERAQVLADKLASGELDAKAMYEAALEALKAAFDEGYELGADNATDYY